MDVFTEYALLFIVAAPLAFAAVAHLACLAAGERGTLILPTVADFRA